MKKGVCIHYMSHRGIGKIVKESNDWKKDDKEMKQGKYDIYCHGCGPDLKTATNNYNIAMGEKKKEAKLLREERKKIRNSKKKLRNSKKSKKNNKSIKKKKKTKSWSNWINGLF